MRKKYNINIILELNLKFMNVLILYIHQLLKVHIIHLLYIVTKLRTKVIEILKYFRLSYAN